MRSIALFILLFCFYQKSSLFANIESATGNILFDVNNDGNSELILNQTGLGIGTMSPSANLHVAGNAIIDSGMVMIGTTSANSTLEINGSLGMSVETISSNTTISDNASIVLVDASSGNLSLTLPFAGNVTGRLYKIKMISTSSNVNILGGGLIDATEQLNINSDSSTLGSVDLIASGNKWHILNLTGTGTSTQVAADNLLGYWKLDETSGTTAVDSGSLSSNGTLTNGFTFSANSTTGSLSNALSFDGNDDYISIGDIAGFDIGTSDLSITAWIKTTAALATDNDIYSILLNDSPGGIGNAGWGFTLRGGGVYKGLVFRFKESAIIDTVPTSDQTATLTDGSWHFVACSADRDGNAVLYIDGVNVRTKDISANSGAIESGSTTAVIGSSSNGATFFFNGSIDDVRFYNKALSASEINTLYTSGLGQ